MGIGLSSSRGKDSILSGSRILQWFLKPGFQSSPFQESCTFQFLLKGVSHLPVISNDLFRKRMFSLAKWLLLAVLFSSIFVPRFSIASLASFYRIDLRMEDLLIFAVVVLLFWAGRFKSLSASTLLERAFLIFLLACQISILNGFFMRTIDKPFMSLLYLMKWVEYFLVFVISIRLVSGSKESSFFLRAFYLLGIAVACYGFWEHFFPFAKAVYPNYYRLFERPPFHGDANHIGGFLVLWMGFFTGRFLKTESRREQVVLLFSLLLTFFVLIWTYSRKSYFALAGALLVAFLFSGGRRRLLVLISLFILSGFLLPTRLGERLLDLAEAFSSTDPLHSSWAGNLSMWKEAFWNFDHFFLFGAGLGSRHRLFYESQYVLVLTETGLAGMVAFLLLCLAPVREVLHFLRRSLAVNDRGMAVGYMVGFLGLAIHNFSCVSWTVSKIAIPFWFLTALVLAQCHSAKEAAWS